MKNPTGPRALVALAFGVLGMLACDDPGSDVPSLESETSSLLTLSVSQSVAAGGLHSCAIVGGGRVRCWGYNGEGQLGNGTTTTSATPVLTADISDAVAIAAGSNHSCALLSSGQIRCWGANYYGQLGHGSTAYTSAVPVTVSGITTAIEITAGANHTCAVLADTTARCWGLNTYRQLGNAGSTTTSRVPVTVQAPGASPLSSIAGVSAGGSHTCAVLTSGGARCWGINIDGQLGNGTNTTVTGIASVVLAAGDVASRVAVGAQHSCAVLTSGQARCWGRNSNGQLGTGSTAGYLTFPTVVRGQYDTVSGPRTYVITTASRMDAGDTHTCLVTSSGSQLCTGKNSDGRLGFGAVGADVRYMRGGLVSVAAVTAGSQHTCSRRAAGEIHCYGGNYYGQTGSSASASPVATPYLAFIDALDGDGVDDRVDNCPTVANLTQSNGDGDLLGDACDPCPTDSSNDDDADGVCGAIDNCPAHPNSDQIDSNTDGQGDACECVGVVCAASDACHLPGVCSPTDGTCSDPISPACSGPPTWPSSAALVATYIDTTSVAVSWTPATHVSGVSSYVLSRDGVVIADLAGTVTSYNVEGLISATSYALAVQARGVGGTSIDGPTLAVTTHAIEVGPTAPPVETGGATTVAAAAEFLYTGTDPVQTDVDQGELEEHRLSVVRGFVTSTAGTPLAGATVTVKDHPELGQTMTQSNGTFAMAVNGGSSLVLVVEKEDHHAAHRSVEVPWQEYTWIDDVALVSYADSPENVITSSSSVMQVARGNVETDADGSRQATVLIPPQTQATLVAPDGTQTPLPSLTVRVTEYTVGALGPRAMPAGLPSGVAYTWAAEFSADEAIAAGASRVEFDRPVFIYVENFLSFPVGASVPMGYYDRDRATWVASDNGRVIEVLGAIPGGPGVTLAQLDLDGDGNADSDTALAALGVTTEERARLASLYAVGQSLWRVPVTHFTPWDANWGMWPPLDAMFPDIDPDELERLLAEGCQQSGSIINCENQSLGERLPIAGTPFQLAYESSRAFGRTALRTIDLKLSGPTMPPSCSRIVLELHIAGRRVTRHFSCAANQSTSYEWDGLDAWGRRLQGSQRLTVRIGYEYGATYAYVPSFGSTPAASMISGNRAAETVTLWSSFVTRLGGHTNTPENSIGGWTLDVHHAIDAADKTFYGGDGQTYAYSPLARIERFHTPAVVNEQLTGALGSAEDGGVYFADSKRIMHRDRAGAVTHIAGINQVGCVVPSVSGPATLARLSSPRDMAVAADGTIFAVNNAQLWSIVPGGSARLLASSTPCSPPGGYGAGVHVIPGSVSSVAVISDGTVFIGGSAGIHRFATDGTMELLPPVCSSPIGIAAGPDDSLYVGCTGAIWRRTNSGVITRIAGNGTTVVSGDGGVAASAGLMNPTHLTVGTDSALYFVDYHRTIIRRIRDGRIDRVAGQPNIGTALGDGGSALDATVYVDALHVHPDGTLLVYQQWQSVLRRITATVSDEVVPSQDGEMAHLIGAGRRHEATVDANGGSLIYGFQYDSEGRLGAVIDHAGNAVTISRDAAGHPTAITGPYGHRTDLTVDAAGYLRTVTNPEGETVTLTHRSNGLLTGLQDAKGFPHTYDYDFRGRLTEDDLPVGFKTLDRTGGPLDFAVALTTQLGMVTQYQVKLLRGAAALVCPDPALGRCNERRVTRPDGVMTLQRYTSNRQAISMPDGSSFEARLMPNPRFGMGAPLVASATFTAPSGFSVTATREQTVQLVTPTNPLSVSRLTDRYGVGSRQYVTEWDGAARTSTETTPEGREEVRYYDTDGQLTRIETPGLHPMDYSYDGRGRVERVTQGDRMTEYVYDPVTGQLQTTRYLVGWDEDVPLFLEHGASYDGADRLTAFTYPDSQTLVYSYDANGNVDGLAPPGRPLHQTSFGAGDLPDSYTPPPLPDGQARTESYDFDLDARLYEVTLADQRTISLLRAPTTGRLSSVQLADWGSITMGYQPDGRVSSLLRQDSAGGMTTMTYGHDGPDVVSMSLARSDLSGSVAYDRSAFVTANRITETINGGSAVAYQYDDDEELISAGPLAIGRDPGTGARHTRSVGALSDVLTRNAYGEHDTAVTSYGGSELLRITYAHDLLGRIERITEQVAGGAAVTRDFHYDLRSQLSSVTGAGGAVLAAYDYDDNGNRIVAPGVTSSSVVIDDHDQLRAYGDLTFAYTLNGEMSAKTSAAGTTAFTWDTLGALRRVTLPSGIVIDYLVDPAGRRIGKRVNGALVQGLIYGGAKRPVAELDATGAMVSRFIYGTSDLVPDLMVRAGVTYVFVTDHLGSVRLVVNTSNGVIAQRLDYDEFGRVLTDTTPGFQPFGYAGGLFDRDTGLLHVGAREYDPYLGRWLSRDPAGFPNGGNRYSYVNNDPINHLDPSGLALEDYLRPVSNFAAGFGDKLTFGLTRKIRKKLGVDDAVDFCSGWYAGGGIAGELTQDYFLGTGVGRLGRLGRYKRCRNSFVAGTMVATPDGLQAIETLEVGDRVIARSDVTGELGERSISEVIVSADKRANDLRIDVNGQIETLGVTSEHPFWVKGRGWSKAHHLKTDDLVFTRSGEWGRVIDKTPRAGFQYVYNLEVEAYHTFFVGETGVWVHNCPDKPGSLGKFKGRQALRAENKIAHDAARAAGLDKDQARILHDQITGQGYSRKEIFQIAVDIKNGIW